MAFDYNELTKIKNKIVNDSEELKQVLNNLNVLVDNNVGKVSTWSSAKATTFKTKWDEFSNNNFPTYEKSFTKQVDILNTAIGSYKEAEGGNTTTSKRINNYEKQVEKISEKKAPNKIINRETAEAAIKKIFKDNKDLTNMVNKSLYENFKAIINGKING